MIEENIVPLIRDLGFPIFVTLWFMFRTETVIKSNTEAVKANTDVVNHLSEKIEKEKN